MLNITMLDDESESKLYKEGKHISRFMEGSYIEEEFNRIVTWDKKAFRDKDSLKMMRMIDGAKRRGRYGVKTPIGRSCITCLSTGCKFGLIMLYYRDCRGVIFTEFNRAGENVWEFLAAQDYEISLFMPMGEDTHIPRLEGITVSVGDKSYNVASDSQELWRALYKYERGLYEPTKETESAVYEKWSKVKKIYKGYPSEEIPLSMLYNESELENVKLCEERGLENCLSDCEDYKVINHCTELPRDFTWRRLCLWIVGRTSSGWEFRQTVSVKYSTLAEVIVEDIICGDYLEDNEFQSYSGLYKEYLALVFDVNERCKVEAYPYNILFGVCCSSGSREVTLLNEHQSVEKFHEWYSKTE